MKTIKVLMLTTSFPLRDNSTSGLFVEKLVDNLSSMVKPLVVVPCDSDKGKLLNNNDYPIRCFKYAPRKLCILAHRPGGIPAALHSSRLYLLLVPFFLIAMFVRCFIEARNVDLIHANWSVCGVIGGIVGKILSKPTITTIRGEDGNNAQSNIASKVLIKIAIYFSSLVVCVSDSLVDKVKLISKIPDTKIVCVPNGIARSLINYNKHAKPNDKANGTLSLITVGNLTENKNVALVIEAVREIILQGKKVSLNVIGDGPEKNKLIKLVHKYNLSEYVHFYGCLHQDKVYHLISKADVFVLSSFREGRPNVLLESMAIGTPIIASNIEGVSELIKDGESGLLYDPCNYKQLATCINKLSADIKLQKILRTKAQEYIKENNLFWDQSAKMYIELYKTALKHK